MGDRFIYLFIYLFYFFLSSSYFYFESFPYEADILYRNDEAACDKGRHGIVECQQSQKYNAANDLKDR